MWSTCVVEAPKAFNLSLSLRKSIEYLTIEEFFAEVGIETLDVSILPRVRSCDICGLGANGGNPFLKRLCGKLRAIFRPDMFRHTPDSEEVGEGVNNIVQLELSVDPDRQAIPRELIRDFQLAILPSIKGAYPPRSAKTRHGWAVPP